MNKLLFVLLLPILMSACTSERQSQPKGEADKSAEIKAERVNYDAPNFGSKKGQEPPSKNANQVRGIANSYDVSQDRVLGVAGRAAELTGGKATTQDMLDALEAASR